MSRRSQRLQAKEPASVDALITSTAASESTPAPSLAAKSGNIKANCASGTAKNGRIVRHKRGSLKLMLKMPLDILIEIMMHLSPKDLLALARTTKDLRAFLMKRTSSQFWKVARLNVEGLPACPGDLSEPAYANLLFDPHCHNCLRKDCNNIYWDCRMRLCRQCYEDFSTPMPWISTCPFRTNQARELFYELSGFDIFPTLYCPIAYCMNDQCYEPHIQKFKDECPAEKDFNALVEYVQAAKDRLASIEETRSSFIAWEQQTQTSNAMRLKKLREERKDSVYTKLVELGYQPELTYMTKSQHADFLRLPEVRKACALSRQSWKNTEGRILAFMDKIKEERLQKLRVGTIKDRLKLIEDLLPQSCPRFYQQSLSVYEVALGIQEIRQIVEHLSTELSKTRLEEALKTIVPIYAADRLKNARHYFAELVREDINIAPSADPLSLAVGIYFKCTLSYCEENGTYAQMMRHYCRTRRNDGDESEYRDIATRMFYGEGIWKADSFATCVHRLQQFVMLYGLDPKVATAEDMDRTNIRLVCPTPHFRP